MNRRGTTLAELLVVLVLGSVVVGLFARSVVGQRRAERAVAGVSAPAVAVDDAVHILAALLARVSLQDSLIVRADTALEWRAVVGAAIACFAAGDSLVVPDSGVAAWWETAPDSGDATELADESGRWFSGEILSIRARASGGVCGGAQRTLRMRASVAAGQTPFVRVTQRLRMTLYRGGDGAWWLGERTCSTGLPVRCGAAQPVAGPLLAPPAGLRFTVDSSATSRAVTISVAAGRTARSLVVPLRR